MKKHKGRIVLEVMSEDKTKTSIDNIVCALTNVLGSDQVHLAYNSDLGTPRYFIPSGVPDLDRVLDREGRGWPSGRIYEIYGAAATAKTGIGYSLIAQAQKMGGVCILYPAEGNWDEWLAERYGIDLSRLILGDDETVEGIFGSWQRAMQKAGKDGLLVGMIDSIAGVTTRAELAEEEITPTRSAQLRAQLISKSLRKLGATMPRTSAILFCINQVRDATDVMFGEKSKPTGGRALPFYASIRLKLENIGKITRALKGKKYVAGFKLEITAMKNRLSMPYQKANIKLDYELGLLSMDDSSDQNKSKKGKRK
jgi:recombination protein RecA